MATEDFTIKKNDTKRSFQATLKYDGSAVDLSGSGVEVKFIMRKVNKTSTKVNASATLADAANGVVKYEWQTEDTDTADTYLGEFKVTYTDGSVESFPSDHYLYIKIVEDLA
jgi:hypothetical protein